MSHRPDGSNHEPVVEEPRVKGFHHVELWVPELQPDLGEWEWLLNRLGFAQSASWDTGASWEAGGAYLSVTTSPTLSDPIHDRRRAGLNHLAFHGGRREVVDAIMDDAPAHGWNLLYPERYPFAGGREHYAGWLENSGGFKAEIVAEP